jgi:CDP-glucose 4,6-dehydratase
LIPDAVRAMACGQALTIRNPHATRPWQHVLEPLSGYLMLAERMLAGDAQLAEAFNFGPEREGNWSVSAILRELQVSWPDLQVTLPAENASPTLHEANFLYLDSSKAHSVLDWQSTWTIQEALAQTAVWYANVAADPRSARRMCETQIEQFERGYHGDH